VGIANWELAKMKKLGFAILLGIALLAPLVKADPGNQNGCGPSGDKPKKCGPTAVPEPGVAILLGSGLLALGGYALVCRKQKLRLGLGLLPSEVKN
jgi:hypothetical protein